MILTREFPSASFEDLAQKMREFTDARNENTPDELWVVEHTPVYTLGQAGKPEHILNPKNIPVIQTDRGGQVTYHGPGQLVIYLLIDIRRKKMGVRNLVTAIENSIIDLLKKYNITAQAKCDAPGVYVGDDKICSIGLRIRRGCSYHGLAFNINMDISPFLGINPCGYAGLKMIQLKDFGIETTPMKIAPELISCLESHLKGN
ncbi:MAG TPA: lipoyl(octanoyl) transferase LipB [Gammaproteobacteria bacterium]|nr:lipoyl(octanoyl) transferase LipB [Gammaproteobacteria bacterium]